MSDKCVIKGDIRNSRHQASMETGIITPEAGMGIDRDEGGDNLRGQEKKNRNIERGFGDVYLFIEYRFNEPG